MSIHCGGPNCSLGECTCGCDDCGEPTRPEHRLSADCFDLIAAAAAKVHKAVAKRRAAAQFGENAYRRADDEHGDALCFYFGVVEAAFGRPANLPAVQRDTPNETGPSDESGAGR